MKYIEKKNKIINDKYTEYIYNSFDIQNKEETTVKIPINFSDCKSFDWNSFSIYWSTFSKEKKCPKNLGRIYCN